MSQPTGRPLASSPPAIAAIAERHRPHALGRWRGMQTLPQRPPNAPFLSNAGYYCSGPLAVRGKEEGQVRTRVCA